MSEKDFENQFSPETGYPRPRRGEGPAIPPPPAPSIPPPPIEDDGGPVIPPPPTRLWDRGDFSTKANKALEAYKAETDQNGDTINPAAETLPAEDGTLPQSTDSAKETKPQKKAQKTPSEATARKTANKTGATKKGGKQTSSQSSHNSTSSQQTQTKNYDASSLVWTILYYAMIMLLFPVYLLTHIILTIIYKVLQFMFIDESNYPEWLFSSDEWAWEHMKMSFVLWRRFIVIAFVILGIIVIIELIKN